MIVVLEQGCGGLGRDRGAGVHQRVRVQTGEGGDEKGIIIASLSWSSSSSSSLSLLPSVYSVFLSFLLIFVLCKWNCPNLF